MEKLSNMKNQKTIDMCTAKARDENVEKSNQSAVQDESEVAPPLPSESRRTNTPIPVIISYIAKR